MLKNSYLSFQGYCVPKDSLSKEQYSLIKKDLTVLPFNINHTEADKEKAKFKVYNIDDNDIITIPRYYGLDKFGHPEKTLYNPEKVKIKFTGKLRDYQENIVNTCLDHIKKEGGGLLVVPCASGKTTMSIYMASQLGYKTLVVTHKTFLQDQWIARCKQFSKSQIGIIRQKKIDTDGKDFVIAMIQSLSKREYDNEILEQFGTVIFDECILGNELIITNKGNIPISQLYEMWISGCELPLIKSYNHINHNFEYKKMTYAWKKYSNNIINIIINNKIIKCTDNHKFLTLDGYIEAKYLEGKILCGIDNNGNMCEFSNIYIQYTNEFLEVYDIEVENNHNFIIANEITTNNNYGVIVHNCHHVAARIFSKALAKTGAKYTIGLSATPYRNDGLIRICNWYLGDIMFRKKMKTNNQVVAKIITFGSKDKKFREKRKYFGGKVKPDCIGMISNLIELDSRNKHIINIIDQLRKTPERKVLILSDRKNHLKLLKDSTDKLIKNDVDAGITLDGECKTYYYTGDTKQEERFEAEQYGDILFATYAMAQEGLDIDKLNTIILATSKKDVIQAVGRILRKILQNGDIRPLVIDFVDNLSIFKSHAGQREEFYKASKYIMHYYYAHDDELISPQKYLSLNGENNPDASTKIPENYEDLLHVSPVEIISDIDDQETDSDLDENINKPKKKQKEKKIYNISNDDVFMF